MVMPKMARRRGSDGNNFEGGKLDPAVDDHRHYKKNILLPFYPA